MVGRNDINEYTYGGDHAVHKDEVTEPEVFVLLIENQA